MADAGFAEGFETTYDVRKVSIYDPLCQIVKQLVDSITLSVSALIRRQ